MDKRTAVFVLLLATVSASPSSAQSSGRFHLVRSASGSKGAPEGNRFIFEDQRVVFQAGKDRQVLVLFEWQGPVGPHHCEGTWKDPSGRVVFTSQADLHARGTRFSVYWGLSIPDSVATGTWVIEARVDGEPAGAHTFQIVAEAGGAAPMPRALPIAELYQLGLATTLTLQILDASRAPVGVTSGFFVTPEFVSTSFAGINAARAVQLLYPSRPQLETSEVVSWNRRDDWAILRFANAGGLPAERAANAPKVGDRVFFLDAQGDQGRVIVETSVVGLSPSGDLTLSEAASETTHGAPVLNEYGAVVATLAGSGILGATALDSLALGATTRLVHPRGARARMLVPAPDAAAASRSLEELERSGLFVRPLVRTPHFVTGILGTGVERQGGIPVATDQRFRFSRTEGQCVVFMTWVPARKEDATTSFQLFDENSQKIAATDPKKTRLRQGNSFVQYWEFGLSALKPGVYRVDALIGSDPVWRTFFRVTD